MNGFGDEREYVRIETLPYRGHILRPGGKVRLNPRRKADAFDMFLAGRIATIVTIEEDFEDQRYVTVAVDDDPGRDFGHALQPGHRFFFALSEIEPLDPGDPPAAEGRA